MEHRGTLKGFAVIIPMYNEETGAQDCVRKVCGVLKDIPLRNALIVVNDGSKDATGEILKKIKPEFPSFVILEHLQNKGYGAALQTGSAYAIQENFEYVLFMDSDLTNDPKDISKFVEKMNDGYDVIKATRYSHGGGVDGVPIRRVFISRCGNSITKFLMNLPITDYTNGYRAVKTELLKKITLKENNFSIIMEELYYLKQLTSSFCNVPVILKDRTCTQRPTSFTYKPSIFWRYIKYPLRSFLENFSKKNTNIHL